MKLLKSLWGALKKFFSHPMNLLSSCFSLMKTSEKILYPSTRWGTAPLSQCSKKIPEWDLPERWIGRASPKAWPPTSPDLTPMDLSYGTALKINFMSLLCQTIFRNSKTGFIDLCNPMTQIPYAKHGDWSTYCLDAVRVTRGAHIKHL
jgi:hypothetical protein